MLVASDPEQAMCDALPSTTLPADTLPTPPKTPTPCQSKILGLDELQIVIAHYNESLDWLNPYAQNCNVYSKGEPAKASQIYRHQQSLPNIGRESHTYLTYIVNNYSSLPPHLLFLQGNIHDINNGTPAHTSLPLSDLIDQTLALKPKSTLPIGLTHTFDSWSAIPYLPGWLQRRGATLKRSHLTPAQFWETITREPHPQSVRFVQGACFGVTREAIQRRPRSFWEGVLRYFEELNEVNPEEGHFMERFWWACFDDTVVSREVDEVGKDKS
jgi:hypothetical protein